MNTQDTHLSRAYNAYNFSSERVAKGDFIRMKEISLSYDFPETMDEPFRIIDRFIKVAGYQTYF